MSRRNTGWNPLGDVVAAPFYAIGAVLGVLEAAGDRQRRRNGAPNYRCAACGRVGTRGFKQAKRKAPILCESIGACQQRQRRVAR